MKKNLFSVVAFVIVTLQHLAAQNVGIGTTTPSQKLDVNGNVNISGTIMTNGTAGTSGQVLTSTGSGLSWSTIGSTMGYKKCRMFTTSGAGSFTVPSGVSEIMVEAWGAGSAGMQFCGGTSGGYARTVQTVSAGSTINFSIGQGSPGGVTYSSSDGGNTTVTFPDGTAMSAYGGGGVQASNVTVTKGLAKSGGGTVSNALYMFGNQGEANENIMVISSTTYTETVHMGSGGAAVAVVNATPIKGAVSYRVNDNVQYAVFSNTIKIPSAGGPAIFNGEKLSGGDGMVIIWYN